MKVVELEPCPFCGGKCYPSQEQGAFNYNVFTVEHTKGCYLASRIRFLRAIDFERWNNRATTTEAKHE